MKINVGNNFPDIARQIDELGRQSLFVTAVALTRTAKDVQGAIKGEMSRAFDRPTNYTLNSTYLKGATKGNLEARVWLKDNVFGKGTPADRYLAPQIFGGVRGHKGMEKALQAVGLMSVGQFAVPAAGAQLDANGNVKRSQIVQIMSQLRAQRAAGFESRATDSTRSKRTRARQGVTYFTVRTKHGGLQPGIYFKRKFAHGTAVRPVFIFTSGIGYQPRFKFFEVGEETAQQRFPAHFQTEMDKASAQAGLR
jgi:hypothetical protein